MANYTNLGRGSKGTDVEKLQKSLVDKGYDIGSSGVDGNYGPDTEAAVKKYQTDNQLKIDGIAGNETLGSLYDGNNSAAKTQQNISTPSVTVPTSEDFATQVNGEKPTLDSKYDKQIEDIYNQIINRKPFSYDINEDALYQQYKDEYITHGKLAKQDAIGQASVMTGGYDNSFAETVGNQAFLDYMQRLNAVMPELYGQAHDRYLQEEQRLYDQYAMLGDMKDDEFARYQSSLDEYWRQNNTDYQRSQDAYDRLVNLITSTGYTPSAEELETAGMSANEASSYAKYYREQKAESARSSSGGNSSRSAESYLEEFETMSAPKNARYSSTDLDKAIKGVASFSTAKGAYEYLKSMIDTDNNGKGISPSQAAKIYAEWLKANAVTADDESEEETEVDFSGWTLYQFKQYVKGIQDSEGHQAAIDEINGLIGKAISRDWAIELISSLY